ncbi:MAG: ABC transporter permease [Bacteroidetes bacterium]|nr:ABC transporter permease [Bacteroidota bacterium]
MNYEYFIAKRIIGSKAYKSSISAPIIKIGIAAIAIGIIVMMIAIATGIGLQQKIRDKAVAFNGHITISKFVNTASDESKNPISINQEFYPELSTVEGITHIQAVATKFGIIRTETDFEGMVFKGVGQDYSWTYFEEFLIDGKLPGFSDKTNNDVLISQYLSNRLNFKVGDSFEMFFMKEDLNKLPFIRKFNIVGIYNSGFQELDKTYLLGDIKHVQRLNKWRPDQIGNFEIFIDDYSQLEAKRDEIDFYKTPTLNTQTVVEKYATIFEWIGIFDKNVYGIIGIMILVAGFNMITALLVLILERTQMIGILKALGSNNWSIQKLFLYNASYLIVLGLFWGNLIGLTLLFVQDYFQILEFPNPKDYYMKTVPIYFNFGYIVALNIGTFLLCLIILLVPSFVITKITPIKAIRFE